MNKVTLPFKVPGADFVPAEFVASSEVDGVPPRLRQGYGCGCGERECEECSDRMRAFRRRAAQLRAEWVQQRKLKMRELGMDEKDID